MIRPARETDGAAFAEIYAPVVRDTVISFEYELPTAKDMAQRVAKILPTHPWLVMEKDGVIAGYAYASQHNERKAYDWAVNVSAYIHQQYRRQGIGKALYTALFDILRHQGYYNAYAGITLPNEGSVGLHEAMGFQPVGVYKSVGFKFGAWHDVGWWQLPLCAHASAPATIIPFSKLEMVA